DGSILSIIGYNPAQSGEYVIGTVNAAGDVSTNTLIVDAIGAPRSAVVEGASVYFNGYENGVRYKALGTTTASDRVSEQQNAPRILTIAETIYGTNESIRIYAPIGTAALPNVNLPTGEVLFSTAPNFPGGATPVSIHQAIAVKAYGRTFIY